MKDIKLLETCKNCNAHITLMESINTDSNKPTLVKRCLNCGDYMVTEVVEIANQGMVKVNCGLITCIHNDGKRVCSNKNLELNYFDDYSIFKDEKLPNTDIKITDYLSTHIGHFMGVQCKDFKMDKYKVMRNPRNG